MLPEEEEEQAWVVTLDDATKAKWYRIVFDLKKQFEKKPDLNGMLYLIGMRELGQNRAFSKDEKMDLMHIATCKLLSYDGYYEFERLDEDGWPHYRAAKPLPRTDLISQENLLRRSIVRYFDEAGLLEG
jgi:hypothetical protein